jgi:hypothetical protein
VQCLSFLYYSVFTGAIYLVFFGTNNALLASIVVILSSHNIIASLCCCSVDYFIPTITIMSYDYKPILNIIVKKLLIVGTCKP